MSLVRAVLLGACVAALSGCGDPVHDAAVDALGAEGETVAIGALHRPGQPCLTCHGDSGPADTVFSYAGTVFDAPSGPHSAPL